MLTVESIKALGTAQARSEENLDYLIKLFVDDAGANKIPVEIKREIVSSIGRQNNKEKVKEFLLTWAIHRGNDCMDVIYQMFRTALYLRGNDPCMYELIEEMRDFYQNEIIEKMYSYYENKAYNSQHPDEIHHTSPIEHPLLLEGDSAETLPELPESSVQLVFTSPPYYNARMYASYANYEAYLQDMGRVFQACYKVLEPGRFMIVNVSPVITKRPGREFESIRYPIHYDFHKVLSEAGFNFIDEIYWIKPEPAVPNRIGGYVQTRKPLGYKPNCITESIMVYRKKCTFLLDATMKKYPEYDKHEDEEIDTTNCWYITPKSDKNHPAVFPEELCRKILRYYSYEGDVVLDPFAGSGTFGRVARQMGRIPVLCERNPEYVELITKRDENYYEHYRI